MGVVVRRYIDFLILLIPTPLVSVLFYSIPTFCSFFNYTNTLKITDFHIPEEVQQHHMHAQPILMNMLIRRDRVNFTVHFFRIIASFS